jgi:hypothetical protein
MRFDILFDLKLLHEQIQQSFSHQNRKLLAVQYKTKEKEILGPCILRKFSYFDIGRDSEDE